MWWVSVFWYMRTPWILEDKVLKKTLLDLQKSFQIFHACPKNLPAHCCGSAFPEDGFSIPPGSGWGGKNAGWLVTWDCSLRTDSASLKSLGSFHLCSSGSLPAHPTGFRGARWAEHLSTRSRPSGVTFQRAHPLPATPFSVHDHGRQRSDRGPQLLSCPYVGLTVHWAVSVRRSTTGRWPSR